MKKKIRIFLKNKYALASLIFMMWICFFNDIDLFFIISSRMEMNALSEEVDTMRDKNQVAQKNLIELSTNMATLEKFARETYYMKKDNEDIFVFKERAH